MGSGRREPDARLKADWGQFAGRQAERPTISEPDPSGRLPLPWPFTPPSACRGWASAAHDL